MKTSLKTLAAILLCTLSLSAQAGGSDVGNGGDGVILNGKIRLLDLVEAGVEDEPFFDTEIEIDSQILEEVKTIFKNIKKFPYDLVARKLTEVRKQDYLMGHSILSAMRMYSWKLVASELVDVKDENTSLVIPQGKLVQLAIRRSKSIMIGRDKWMKLDDGNRVALVFHECIYAFGMNTSPDSREITGHLFMQDFKDRGSSMTAELVRWTYLPYGDQNIPLVYRDSKGDWYYTPAVNVHIRFGDYAFEDIGSYRDVVGNSDHVKKEAAKFCKDYADWKGDPMLTVSLSYHTYLYRFNILSKRDPGVVVETYVDFTLSDNPGYYFPAQRFDRKKCTSSVAEIIERTLKNDTVFYPYNH